jgi:hypothetical protein
MPQNYTTTCSGQVTLVSDPRTPRTLPAGSVITTDDVVDNTLPIGSTAVVGNWVGDPSMNGQAVSTKSVITVM